MIRLTGIIFKQSTQKIEQQAMKAIEVGRYSEATQLLSKYMRLVPHDNDMRISKGSVEFQRGNLSSAIKDFELAIPNAKPQQKAELYFMLAAACAQAGKCEKATRAIQQALKLDPHNEEYRQLHLNLSNLH